ncbi:DUF3290 domain-containing protein [uncultured Limosilactobacillus sp.]|uniref:DUF3290 domain-containing protein n=1 Tax=uncultured Limosilactobacillus sp. TaxID=2837629 RepID=UPI00260133E7|nr:DUF3290 domain-containing protein [uncultured Limosilactobacillus sp.]
MTFYNLTYLETHQQANTIFSYSLMIIFAGLILVMLVQYVRHRLETKYRDLGIIFSLILLIIIGLQYTKLESLNTEKSQSSLMIPFVKAVAKDHHVQTKDVVVNSTTLTDGIIVRIKDDDYRVNLSSDGNNYTLTRAHVIDHRVMIKNH